MDPQVPNQRMCWPYNNNNYEIFMRPERRRRPEVSCVRLTQGYKWKIIISTLIFALCQTSHVLAIRKGRLMSPSTFTALSGDLHVQIQFSNDGDANRGGDVMDATTTTKTTTTITTMPTTATATTTTTNYSTDHQPAILENVILSTLVISKYLEDQEDHNKTTTENATTPTTTTTSSSSTTTTTTTAEQLLQRKRKEIVQNIPLYPDPRHNVTQIAVPCQTFKRGGLYEMQVITNLKTTSVLSSGESNTTTSSTTTSSASLSALKPTITTTTLMPISDERLRQTLDVRWPSAEMKVSPVRLNTYPEQPVTVELRFPQVNCDRAFENADELPEFWLELIYCGKERSCGPGNVTKANILYAEQIRGFPKLKTLQLSCDLFGLAGNYAVQLRPMIPAPNVPITRRFLSVDWSDKFIFNVYARSVFPCDPHTGIGVLYEYPSCILEQGDRVRVYAKLRADVASLKPPTTLHYVAEQRVVKSQYSLYFNCDLFTEKYVEYCFVYVSQAISGAVADVRMDCVPTLPVSDSDTGGWGPWSEWTPCSTNCLGGTRNRYRFCDSPPPRYGAKFCEGPSVETEKCGKSITDTWDCIYETSGSTKTNRTEVSQEIGPGCRCGCIVHLGSSKPKRVMAGATQSCPGRSFWLIQVDGMQHISLSLNFLRLPCPSQYVKIRDGPSLSSTLLSEVKGGVGNLMNMPATLESSGAQLLLEFYAGDVDVDGDGAADSETPRRTRRSSSTATACTGGFLANAEQIVKNATATKTLLAGLSFRSRAVMQKPKLRSGFTLVHLSAVIFASIIILISALLGAQYVVRYRKYHIAIAKRRDEGSRLHTPHASMTSLHSHNPPSRALSTTTLISEVFYLVKLRPKHQLRHSILRESVDAENLARGETEFNDLGSETQLNNRRHSEHLGSADSIVTLRNEIISPIAENSISRSPSDEELRSAAHNDNDDVDDDEQSNSNNNNVSSTGADGVSSRSGTLTRKDSAKDTESIISSGMSSLCHSPPMNGNRLSKYSDRYDAVTLKLRNSRFDALSSKDGDSLRSLALSHLGGGGRSRCASVSLTNGCYSPAASVVSTATIRTTNAKESKEKQNRKKLLARPGSEFSLGQQEELELDYYDYNVINAGAAPGSYLGMDPAHLIWIPPFDEMRDDGDEEDKTPEPSVHEPDETVPLYEEIKMPKYGHYLSPGSNTDTSSTNNTSPTSDELSPLNSNDQSKVTSPNDSNRLIRNCLMAREPLQGSPHTKRRRDERKQQSKSSQSLGKCRLAETISMQELSATKSERNVATTRTPAQSPTPQQEDGGGAKHSQPADAMTGSYVEKETTVEKSPSDLHNYLELDDIQFADDSESDYDCVPKAAADTGKLHTQHKHKMSVHQQHKVRDFVVTHI